MSSPATDDFDPRINRELDVLARGVLLISKMVRRSGGNEIRLELSELEFYQIGCFFPNLVHLFASTLDNGLRGLNRYLYNHGLQITAYLNDEQSSFSMLLRYLPNFEDEDESTESDDA